MRSAFTVLLLVAVLSCPSAMDATGPAHSPWDTSRGLLVDGATVVTMDDAHTVVPHGRVLVRGGRIVAVWSGPQPPAGVSVGDASVISAGPQDVLFPGLINLHSQPNDNMLEAWLPPGRTSASRLSNERLMWSGVVGRRGSARVPR
jgi:hypothetical protein